MKTHTTKAQIEKARQILKRASVKVVKSLDIRDYDTEDEVLQITRYSEILEALCREFRLMLAFDAVEETYRRGNSLKRAR